MPLLIKTRLGLAAKLAICVIASTAAFFALFGYINLRMERSASEDLIKQSAYRVADVILRSTHEEMLHNDRDALYNIIRGLGSETGIRRIRLFNKEGRITLSTKPAKSTRWWIRTPKPATDATSNRRRSPN